MDVTSVIAFLAAGIGPLTPTVVASIAAVIAIYLWLLARRLEKVDPNTPMLIVDGSNIMHWRGDGPDLQTIRDVMAHLADAGYRVGVVFDANVGYKLFDKFMGNKALARKLGLTADQVVVVDKGHRADLLILQVARNVGARVVSNDRFREWALDYPEVEVPGHVIGGHFDDEQLVIALDKAKKKSPARPARGGQAGQPRTLTDQML